jgi:hypothetical protein
VPILKTIVFYRLRCPNVGHTFRFLESGGLNSEFS